MALVVPISGPYTSTWDALPLGTLNDDGYRLSCTVQGQEINETDAYGMTLVEAIYRGQNWRMRLVGLEFDKTGLLNLLQMFGLSGAARSLTPVLRNVGDRWSSYCFPMVLTAILADPPTFVQSLTATSAGLAPQQQTEFMMTSKMREMPLELVLFPYAHTVGSVTSNIPFSTT